MAVPEKAEQLDCIRILIADDHPVLRDGLRKLIELQPGMTVVGEAADGQEALSGVLTCRPDLVLMDMAMPHGGLGLLKELSRSPNPCKVIVLTAEINQTEVVEALRCGASGIVMKDTATQLLFKAIRAVAAGEYWIRRDSVPQLVDALRNLKQPTYEVPQKMFGLTPRELEIVAAILAGCTNRAIAERFAISDQTVKNHLTMIFSKTGVSNRLELALFAAKHRLINEN